MVAAYVQYKNNFTHYCSEGIFQNIELDACKLYELSFWVRNPSTDISLTDFYIVAANGLQNNSEFACNVPPNISDTMIIYHGENLAPGGWQKITTSFIPNKNYNQLWIYPRQTVYHYYSSEFTIDDISISKANISALSGNAVCYSGNYSFSLSNLPSNSSIYWTHSNNLTYISGQGTSIYKVRAKYSSTSGQGWIRANVSFNDCSFSLTKYIWVGRPGQPVTNPYGYPTVQMSLGQMKSIWVTSAPGNPYQYIWNITGSIEKISGGVSHVVVEAVNTGWGNFRVKTRNQCGYSANGGGSVNVSSGGGGGMMLSVSPNPASSEITISINSKYEEETFDENKQWDLEIYNRYYFLQEKRHKIKGSTIHINTSSWKESIYYIKAIFKDKVVTGKMIIKR